MVAILVRLVHLTTVSRILDGYDVYSHRATRSTAFSKKKEETRAKKKERERVRTTSNGVARNHSRRSSNY